MLAIEPVLRNSAADLKRLVTELQHEDSTRRHLACKEVARVFPEHGSLVFHPNVCLVLLFRTLASAEHSSWSYEWFFDNLCAGVAALAALPSTEFSDILTMRTVFEREVTLVH